MVTQELGEAFRDAGHEVAFFTPNPGPFGEGMAKDIGPLISIENRQALLEFHPDVVHAHDWPSLVALQDLGVTAPAVMAALGPLPAVHNPPPLDHQQRISWWAVSEETRRNVSGVRGWADQTHRIVPTWFDDRSLARQEPPNKSHIRRVLVVSNHFPPAALQDLRTIGSRRGFEVDHIGLPGEQRKVNADLLLEYDAVVSLGRTVVLALALGIPALVADTHGGDGWVTPQSIADLESCNFSGRARALACNLESFDAWFAAPPVWEELAEVQGLVWSSRRFTEASATLERILVEAVRTGAQWQFGRWSPVLAELMMVRRLDSLELSALRTSLHDAQEQQAASAAQVRRLTDELAEVQGIYEETQRRYEYVSAQWSKYTLQRLRRRFRRRG